MLLFFARHGERIIVSLIASLILVTCYLFLWAVHESLPGNLPGFMKAFHVWCSGKLDSAWSWVVNNPNYVGAIFQVVASIVAIVGGISLVRGLLPQRLKAFIERQIKFLYPLSERIRAQEALIGTVSRTAVARQDRVLFNAGPLALALKNIGKMSKWDTSGATPVRSGLPANLTSLAAVVQESEVMIGVAGARLNALHELNAHAHLVSGALASAESRMTTDQSERAAFVERAEVHFTQAIENASTKVAALELRGLLRSREEQFQLAATDFAELEVACPSDEQYLIRARSHRCRGELKHMQGSRGGRNARLTEAQVHLGIGWDVINGRLAQLSSDDCFELGENQTVYGDNKLALWRRIPLAEPIHRARIAYEEAIRQFGTSGHPSALERIKVVEARLANLKKEEDAAADAHGPRGSDAPSDGSELAGKER